MTNNFQINNFTIGSMNVTDPNIINLVGFNIYEDILNPLGPVGEVRLYDFNGALSQSGINGKEDVSIGFGNDSGSLNFKFKLYHDPKQNDGSQSGQSSMHSKQIDMRFISEEYINAHGNYVSNSYNTQTSNVLKSMLTDNLKTTKQIDIQDATKGNRRIVFGNEHFLSAYKKLNHEHVSSNYNSSCYVCFVQNGSQSKYVFTTFEKLFEQSSVVKLSQTTNLSDGTASDTDQQNSITWFNPSSSFNSVVRPLVKPSEQTYNLVTGEVHSVPPATPPTFKFADSTPVFNNAPANTNFVPSNTVHDPANNKTDTYTADAKKKRATYLSMLSQTSAELEIPGNPNIKLGSIIELNIPKKSSENQDQGESEHNGKALVVGIRHKVKPVGQEPRYTMVLRVVKGSYKQGGGGNG